MKTSDCDLMEFICHICGNYVEFGNLNCPICGCLCKQELSFDSSVGVMRWEFENGDTLMIEKNDKGYLLSGNINGQDLHDEDHEDFHFSNTDILLDFLEEHNLLQVLGDNHGI